MKNLKYPCIIALMACIFFLVASVSVAKEDAWGLEESGDKYGSPAATIGDLFDENGQFRDSTTFISVECRPNGILEFAFNAFDNYTPGIGKMRFDFYGKSGIVSYEATVSYNRGWGDMEVIGPDAAALLTLFKKYERVEYFFPQDVRRVKFTLIGFTRAASQLRC